MADTRSKAQKLRDAFLAHAVFLEGLRNWQASLFVPIAETIRSEITLILAKVKGALNARRKADIKSIANRIRGVIINAMKTYKWTMLAQLQKFLRKDVHVFTALLTALTGISYQQAATKSTSSIYGTLAASDTFRGNDRLWSSLSNAIMPATGLTIATSFDQLSTYAQIQFVKTLNTSYANNETADDLETDLFGADASNNRDGILNRLTNAATSVGSTSFAFASSVANTAVSSVYYGRYQWISVLDSRTSDICQSRADEIYTYGAGPVPPAHPNCRSTIVPYDVADGDTDDDQSFNDWVRSRSSTLQAAMFPPSALDRSPVIPQGARPVTPDDFDTYIDEMLQLTSE